MQDAKNAFDLVIVCQLHTEQKLVIDFEKSDVPEDLDAPAIFAVHPCPLCQKGHT